MLIGSGTGVSTWLVTKLISPGVVKTTVSICWSAYRGLRVEIDECTVSEGGVVMPLHRSGSLLRMPAGEVQKPGIVLPGSVEGVFPLAWSTQFSKLSVPVPTCDVNCKLAVQLMLPGGAVGKEKSWAENQNVTVVAAVATTSTVLPDWFALGKGTPPGELEDPLRVLIVTGGATMGLGEQVAKVLEGESAH